MFERIGFIVFGVNACFDLHGFRVGGMHLAYLILKHTTGIVSRSVASRYLFKHAVN